MFTNSSQQGGYGQRSDKKYLKGAHPKLSCEITKVMPRYPNKDKSMPIEFYSVEFKILSGEFEGYVHYERYNLNQAWKMVYLAKACGTPMRGNELPVDYDPMSCEGYKVTISTRENENNGKVYTNLFKIWKTEIPAIPAEPLKTEDAGTAGFIRVGDAAPVEGVLTTNNDKIKGFPTSMEALGQKPPSPETANAIIQSGIQQIAEKMPQFKEGVTPEKEEIF